MDIFSVSTDSMFTYSAQQNAQRETNALRALNTGLQQFSARNYESAISSFKRAIRMAPTADSALNAYDYMARAHLTRGETQAGIDAYIQALKIAPNRDDLHSRLGNVYTSQNRFEEARAEYELAVKYNPSAANRYSLGQGFLGAGQYDEAIQQFEQVRRMDAKNPYGYFGLGQTYGKQGKHDEAIAAFKSAIGIQYDYLDAYAEMGYAYTDKGDIERAKDVVSTLNNLSPNDVSLAASLSQYIYEKTQPKMTVAYVSDLYTPFVSTLGPRTSLAGMNSYLANAGAEHTFSMVFQFDKPMSQSSVENVFNWNIARATGSGRADGYNYDMTLPSTEVNIAPTPVGVYYNKNEQTATVLFKIRQNQTADGTLDPSHINFSFNGKDAVGLSMDKSADMYSGFSGFA